MKRIYQVLLAVLISSFAVQAQATWTFTGSVAQHGNESWVVTVLCTCDGSASGAQNVFTSTITGITKNNLQSINGGFLMSVSVSPGLTAVAPDGAYDVNVYDANGTQTIDKTTTSEATKHTYDPSETVGATQQVLSSIPFDIGDLGTSGDQTTLRFNIYKPKKP